MIDNVKASNDPLEAMIAFENSVETMTKHTVTKRYDGGAILSKYQSPLGRNCVAFAKSKKNIPQQNLYSLKAKVDMINTHKPEVGAVAIMADGPSGHLAIVKSVEKDGVIIEDGNYLHGYVTTRKVAMNSALGYFK